jgi:hypothetical protein
MLLATAASTAWMPGDVAVNNPSPVMGNHEETVQWLFKKVDQRFVDTGLLGTFPIQRKTVLSEMSKLSIFNSP